MKQISFKPLAKFLKNPPRLSSLIKEHIKTGKPLLETDIPKGSEEYMQLFKEARELYSKGVINILNDKDLNIIKNTKLGEIGLFNENIVPLDFPIREGNDVFIYSLDPIDKKVNKVFLNESYDERLFQIEAKIILDKNERDINETLSDIRAIKGVTIVHIEDVDELWSEETQHSLKVKIKIDPAPFDSMNKSVFMMILNEIKKMPGVLKAAYVTKPKTI